MSLTNENVFIAFMSYRINFLQKNVLTAMKPQASNAPAVNCDQINKFIGVCIIGLQNYNQ